MAKLKVTVFKSSGKYYTEETYNLQDFPSIYNQDSSMAIKDLAQKQRQECIRIKEEIEKGNMTCYCPVTSWSGYVFVLDGIFEDQEQGFLTYLIDRTAK